MVKHRGPAAMPPRLKAFAVGVKITLERLVSARWRRMADTTGFFRNVAQIEVLSEIVPAPKLAYVFGCSRGCEAYSLAMYYQIRNPEGPLRIKGFDIKKDLVEDARKAVFPLERVDYYQRGDILKGPFGRFFEQVGPDAYAVDEAVASRCSFAVGDASDPKFMGTLPPADIVFCQNLLVHLNWSSNKRIVNLLMDLLHEGSVLALGGMRPDWRSALTQTHGLVPITRGCREIYDGWRDLRGLWDERHHMVRPYCALPPFTECKDWPYRYGNLFRLPPPSGGAGAVECPEAPGT